MFLLNSFGIIGTIAFDISGALTGIGKKLDIFGIIFLAITTVVCGEIFRDIIIGSTLPSAFVDPKFCIISIIAAFIVFFLYENINKFEKIIMISDALGLGVFTAIGSNIYSHMIRTSDELAADALDDILTPRGVTRRLG